MKKILYLNFYNILKVECPSNIDLNYFNSFKTSSKKIDKEVFLKLNEVDKIDKSNSLLVSNYLAYNSDNKQIFLIDKNQKYSESIFGLVNDKNITINFEKGFSSEQIVSYIIKPILRKVLIKNNLALIHASSFVNDNGATLIAAWAHTGKTSTLLRNIINGSEYLGDDLSVIGADGYIKPFPSPINLFYYNFKQIPELKSFLKTSFKLKFFLTTTISSIFNFLNKLASSEKMKYLFYAGKTFFDAASHVPFKIKPKYLEHIETVNFNVVKNILLERSCSKENKIIVLDITAEDFSYRMQKCINYEFQRFNELTLSALWIPFYNGEDLSNDDEYSIYLKFAKKIKPENIVIPQQMDFKDTDYLKALKNE